MVFQQRCRLRAGRRLGSIALLSNTQGFERSSVTDPDRRANACRMQGNKSLTRTTAAPPCSTNRRLAGKGGSSLRDIDRAGYQDAQQVYKRLYTAIERLRSGGCEDWSCIDARAGPSVAPVHTSRARTSCWRLNSGSCGITARGFALPLETIIIGGQEIAMETCAP